MSERVFHDKRYWQALYAALGLGRELFFDPYRDRYVLRKRSAA